MTARTPARTGPRNPRNAQPPQSPKYNLRNRTADPDQTPTTPAAPASASASASARRAGLRSGLRSASKPATATPAVSTPAAAVPAASADSTPAAQRQLFLTPAAATAASAAAVSAVPPPSSPTPSISASASASERTASRTADFRQSYANLSEWSRKELIEECRRLGLSYQGRKAEAAARIRAHVGHVAPLGDDSAIPAPPAGRTTRATRAARASSVAAAAAATVSSSSTAAAATAAQGTRTRDTPARRRRRATTVAAVAPVSVAATTAATAAATIEHAVAAASAAVSTTALPADAVSPSLAARRAPGPEGPRVSSNVIAARLRRQTVAGPDRPSTRASSRTTVREVQRDEEAASDVAGDDNEERAEDGCLPTTEKSREDQETGMYDLDNVHADASEIEQALGKPADVPLPAVAADVSGMRNPAPESNAMDTDELAANDALQDLDGNEAPKEQTTTSDGEAVELKPQGTPASQKKKRTIAEIFKLVEADPQPEPTALEEAHDNLSNVQTETLEPSHEKSTSARKKLREQDENERDSVENPGQLTGGVAEPAEIAIGNTEGTAEPVEIVVGESESIAATVEAPSRTTEPVPQEVEISVTPEAARSSRRTSTRVLRSGARLGHDADTLLDGTTIDDLSRRRRTVDPIPLVTSEPIQRLTSKSVEMAIGLALRRTVGERTAIVIPNHVDVPLEQGQPGEYAEGEPDHVTVEPGALLSVPSDLQRGKEDSGESAFETQGMKEPILPRRIETVLNKDGQMPVKFDVAPPDLAPTISPTDEDEVLDEGQADITDDPMDLCSPEKVPVKDTLKERRNEGESFSVGYDEVEAVPSPEREEQTVNSEELKVTNSTKDAQPSARDHRKDTSSRLVDGAVHVPMVSTPVHHKAQDNIEETVDGNSGHGAQVILNEVNADVVSQQAGAASVPLQQPSPDPTGKSPDDPVNTGLDTYEQPSIHADPHPGPLRLVFDDNSGKDGYFSESPLPSPRDPQAPSEPAIDTIGEVDQTPEPHPTAVSPTSTPQAGSEAGMEISPRQAQPPAISPEESPVRASAPEVDLAPDVDPHQYFPYSAAESLASSDAAESDEDDGIERGARSAASEEDSASAGNYSEQQDPEPSGTQGAPQGAFDEDEVVVIDDSDSDAPSPMPPPFAQPEESSAGEEPDSPAEPTTQPQATDEGDYEQSFDSDSDHHSAIASPGLTTEVAVDAPRSTAGKEPIKNRPASPSREAAPQSESSREQKIASDSENASTRQWAVAANRPDEGRRSQGNILEDGTASDRDTVRKPVMPATNDVDSLMPHAPGHVSAADGPEIIGSPQLSPPPRPDNDPDRMDRSARKRTREEVLSAKDVATGRPPTPIAVEEAEETRPSKRRRQTTAGSVMPTPALSIKSLRPMFRSVDASTTVSGDRAPVDGVSRSLSFGATSQSNMNEAILARLNRIEQSETCRKFEAFREMDRCDRDNGTAAAAPPLFAPKPPLPSGGGAGARRGVGKSTARMKAKVSVVTARRGWDRHALALASARKAREMAERMMRGAGPRTWVPGDSVRR